MMAVSAVWKPADHASARPQLSCSKKISGFCAILFQRLGNDAHVGNTRLLHGVHHGGESPEWHVLIRAQENKLIARIANLLVKLGGYLVNVNRVVAQEDALILVDGDHNALFTDLLDSLGFGHVDFNSRLQDRGGHHEDDEKHEHNVDQRRDIDVSQSGLRAPVRRGEGHQRLTSTAGCGCMLSIAFSTSREKSSPRAANTRIELPIRL